MEIQLSELKLWLKDIWNIIVDLNISTNNMMRLKEDRYEFEKDSKKWKFFQHHWYQLKFISIIQLWKLLSTSFNDKRSFRMLCKTLETSEYDEDFELLLAENLNKIETLFKSKDDLLNACQKIMSKIHDKESLIKKVKNARNKIYAHKDPEAIVEYISLAEIIELVDLVNESYNALSFGLFFESTMFKETETWSIDPVLFYMSEVYKLDKIEKDRKANA